MKLNRYFVMVLAMTGAVSLASCLDYDDPGDTLQSNEVQLPDNVYHGNVDSIDYQKEYTEEQLDASMRRLTV